MVTEKQAIEFIAQISPLVLTYSKLYGYPFASPIIGQACLESDYGQSELALFAKNYFGLKYTPGRCPTADGFYTKVGSEQSADGSYSSSVMTWMRFPDMAACVQGYFDFLEYSSRYKMLKTAKTPLEYLQLIKASGYATSLMYVDNVRSVMDKWDLYSLDSSETTPESSETKHLTINVHAGHNPDGKVACGAIGLIKESTENRAVKELVITKLRSLGHTVYDCTCDDGTSVLNVLENICFKANAHNVDIDVSIHFNSSSNSQAHGTEVLVYSHDGGATGYAENVCSEISKLGFNNRGVKLRPDLYYLKNTEAPALLVECCFVSSAEDVGRYNAESMANAIVVGLTGQEVSDENQKAEEESKVDSEGETLYRVQVGAYRSLDNALKKKEWVESLNIENLNAMIVRL